MDNIIYSSSPLRAFSGGLIVIALLLVLGVIGALWAVFRRKERTIARIGMGFATIILILAGIGVAISLIRTIQSGDKTVAVHAVSFCSTRKSTAGIRRKHSPFGRNKAYGNAGLSVIKLIVNIGRNALKAIDISPGHLPFAKFFFQG